MYLAMTMSRAVLAGTAWMAAALHTGAFNMATVRRTMAAAARAGVELEGQHHLVPLLTVAVAVAVVVVGHDDRLEKVQHIHFRLGMGLLLPLVFESRIALRFGCMSLA